MSARSVHEAIDAMPGFSIEERVYFKAVLDMPADRFRELISALDAGNQQTAAAIFGSCGQAAAARLMARRGRGGERW